MGSPSHTSIKYLVLTKVPGNMLTSSTKLIQRHTEEFEQAICITPTHERNTLLAVEIVETRCSDSIDAEDTAKT